MNAGSKGDAYTDIIHHHLVQTGRTERALDNIGDGLRSKDYIVISIDLLGRGNPSVHTVLLPHISAGDFLPPQDCARLVSDSCQGKGFGSWGEDSQRVSAFRGCSKMPAMMVKQTEM